MFSPQTKVQTKGKWTQPVELNNVFFRYKSFFCSWLFDGDNKISNFQLWGFSTLLFIAQLVINRFNWLVLMSNMTNCIMPEKVSSLLSFDKCEIIKTGIENNFPSACFPFAMLDNFQMKWFFSRFFRILIKIQWAWNWKHLKKKQFLLFLNHKICILFNIFIYVEVGQLHELIFFIYVMELNLWREFKL